MTPFGRMTGPGCGGTWPRHAWWRAWGWDLDPATCMGEDNGAGPGPCHMHGGGQWGGTWSLPHAWWGTANPMYTPIWHPEEQTEGRESCGG